MSLERRICSCGQAFEVRVDDTTIPGTYEFRTVDTNQRVERCPRCDVDLVFALEFGEILSQ